MTIPIDMCEGEDAQTSATCAGRWRRGLLVGLIFFAGIAPTLTWLEFSNGIENLNVETALEMRRGGPWLVPTLMGEPRVRKPPLNAWITAAAIDPRTVADMSSEHASTREQAWKQLAWQTRWPALLASCLTLVFAYHLGATLLGPRAGMYGAIIAGTTLLFLKYARSATTDVHLALWVTAANACIAKLIFERRIWIGLAGAGFALGMGMMSKGPVTFVMTVAPALVFILWRRALEAPHAGAERTRAAPDRVPNESGEIRGAASTLCPGVGGTAALGFLLMLLVGFSWFVYAMLRHRAPTSVWWMEVFRTDPTEAATAHWYDYLKLFAQMLPWTPLFVAGLCSAALLTWRATGNQLDPQHRDRALRLIYAAALVVVPILIMSFFRDRKVRYLYPFAIPCGIITAKALIDLIEADARRKLGEWLARVHWMILAGLVIGLPIAGMIGLDSQARVDGSPWFTPAFGISAALAGAVLVLTCARLQRRHPGAVVPGTLLAMLLFQAVNTKGNSVGRSGDGASEMLPLARMLWEKHPDVAPYDIDDGRKRIPPDLAIYMNRPIKKAAQVPDASRTQLIVVVQKRDADEPPPPPGWTLFAKVPRDKDWWVAFVRLPE